jgi:hypothetical protein
LIDAVSDDPMFLHSVKVPDGFLGSALPVPHPIAGSLYVKLRDDPSVVNRTSLAMQEIPPSPEAAARADIRGSAVSGEHLTDLGVPPIR